MPRVEANGLGFEVADEGAGTPVVLLHGFPDTSALWRDRDRALYMAGLPSVTFRPVKGYAHHHLVIELIRRGEFGDVLKSGLGLE